MSENNLEKILNDPSGEIEKDNLNQGQEKIEENVVNDAENKYDQQNEMVEEKMENSVNMDDMEEATQEISFSHKTEKKQKTTFKQLASIAMIAAFAGCVTGLAFTGTMKIMEKNNIVQAGVVSSNLGAAQLVEAPDGDVVSMSIPTVAKSVMPTVVSITNVGVQEVESFFFGRYEHEFESVGSGIIIGKNDDELLIVTNNHVIEGNKTLTVTFIDNSSTEAVVKGADPNVDLAIISVKLKDLGEETSKEIKVATLGKSEEVVVGEPVIAIGNALGYGQSVTSGIISALERDLYGFDTHLLQTDAAINPGNSGGALLNIRGEVIGINTAKLADDAVEGMGYAIPISEVKEIITSLMERETRERVPESQRGKLGISCIDVDETAAKYYGMPMGAYISEVVENGAANKAGLMKGSIITAVDDQLVTSSTALVDLLSYYRVGETVEIKVSIPTQYGEYEERLVKVTLAADQMIYG